jgi:heme-degrading monooxygenase HmoA
MAVKIIIERSADADKQGELLELLRELRARATLQPGYVSGETLLSVDRPGTHLIISTWHSLQDWRTWESHPQRLEVLSKIERLLISPSRTGVFVEPWAALPEGV